MDEAAYLAMADEGIRARWLAAYGTPAQRSDPSSPFFGMKTPFDAGWGSQGQPDQLAQVTRRAIVAEAQVKTLTGQVQHLERENRELEAFLLHQGKAPK